MLEYRGKYFRYKWGGYKKRYLRDIYFCLRQRVLLGWEGLENR
jgi:hypothetical protein